MHKMKKLYANYSTFLSKLDFVPLLFTRLILAYGFYDPAMSKIKDISSISGWFESMEIPFPTLNAYLATYTEFFGIWLLLLGLGVRIITVPLIITMIVAIKTVHLENGFAAGDNGFEIPLYYMAMLFTLLIFGGGKLSIDALLVKRKR